MKVSIRDSGALRAVSPAALAAYARVAGWHQSGTYGEYSDIYDGEELPEIIVPRTECLADYANVVSSLIETFSEVAEQDALTVYRSLVTADRDVIRVRAGEMDDGSVTLVAGIDLIGGAHDLLLSAACSLIEPRSVYRAGANKEASELLKHVRLGQTDQGSFVVTLLTPAVPPTELALFPDLDDGNPPMGRRLTMRLVEALTAAHQSAERAATGDDAAFQGTVDVGVSANLCEALVRIIEPFPTLDVVFSWASTRPVSMPTRSAVRFDQADAAQLREAALSFRQRAPRPHIELRGWVGRLKRGESENDGTIHLATDIDGKRQSVTADLERADYERAVQAHKDQAVVVLVGDLERTGQHWTLRSPRLTRVIPDDASESLDA